MKQKNIHFIGICGVAMSALALAFKRAGWAVTGSDAGFFPPVSTHLKNAGVSYYPGWHPDKMVANGTPDLVVVGNVASSQNPEWLHVQKHKIPYVSYPELVAREFIKQNSIVCAGTYGKTTSTALMAWILSKNNWHPSYMFGGLCLADFPSAEMNQGDWSVVEGDEYKTGRADTRPKFAHYAPTHLLLTSVVWDHADVYPTEQSYRAAFQSLVESVPKNGLLVISKKALPMIRPGGAKIISYGKQENNDYRYANVQVSERGTFCDVVRGGETFRVETACLGDYMADNLTGCFALAEKIGLTPEQIIPAIKSFPGLKRRLERRHTGTIPVYDDIAHSPSKAEAVLTTLRQITPGKLIAIFEPNTGNRERALIKSYNNAFAEADEVIIPHLTKIKIDTSASEQPLEGHELAAIIGSTHPRVQYLEKDQALVEYIVATAKPKDTVVFLGSHGFRGMIEAIANQLP